MDQRQLAKKTSNALERLDQVERTVNNIGAATNNNINQLGGITEVLDAVVQTLGAETIQKIMTDNRTAKAEAQSAQEKAALDELVKNGDVKATEKVSERSIVVGREINPDGTVRVPGRAQVAFARIDPAFQKAFLDQAAGFSLDLPNGGKFEVQEVYEVVEKAEKTELIDGPPAAATTPAAPAAEATEPAAP